MHRVRAVAQTAHQGADTHIGHFLELREHGLRRGALLVLRGHEALKQSLKRCCVSAQKRRHGFRHGALSAKAARDLSSLAAEPPATWEQTFAGREALLGTLTLPHACTANMQLLRKARGKVRNFDEHAAPQLGAESPRWIANRNLILKPLRRHSASTPFLASSAHALQCECSVRVVELFVGRP